MDPKKKKAEDKKKLLETESDMSLSIQEESIIGRQGKKKNDKKKDKEEEYEEEGREEQEEDDENNEEGEEGDEEEGEEEGKKDDEKEDEGEGEGKGEGEEDDGKKEEDEEEGEGEGEGEDEDQVKQDEKNKFLTKRGKTFLRKDSDAEDDVEEGEESPDYDSGYGGSENEGFGGYGYGYYDDGDGDDYYYDDEEEYDEEEEEEDEDEGEQEQDETMMEKEKEEEGPEVPEEFNLDASIYEPPKEREIEPRQPGLTVISIDSGVIFSKMNQGPQPIQVFSSAQAQAQDAAQQKPKEKKESTLIKDEHIQAILKAAAALNPLKRAQKPLPSKEANTAALQNKAVRERKEVTSAINRRKRMRYIAYFVYLIIIGVVIGVAFKFLMIRDGFSSAANTDFLFNIDNCTLLITDNTDNPSTPIYAKYRVPTQLQPDSPTTVAYNTGSGLQTLTVYNGIDPRYCLIQLFITPNTPLNSLTFSCARCNITQDTSSPLIVNGLLNVNGDVVHANFRDVQVGSINFQSITGYLQLNHIVSSPQAVNNINVTNQGDIIIQSTLDFLVNGATDTQAFCFNAPFIFNGPNINNCTLSTNPSQFNGSYPPCQLSYYICADNNCNGTTMPIYNINSTTGNIFANIIPATGNATANGTTFKGEIYNGGLSFDPQTNESVSSFDDLVTDQSKGNPFILLNVGDYRSRSSRYTKWVISSTPSYSLMRPWWIGTFSVGVLDGYVETVNGFLLPGVCPFTPEYTTQDLLNVQNLIDNNIQTLNTLVTFVYDQNLPPPPVTPQYNTGVFPLIDKGNPFDYWYNADLASNGKIILENNDYSNRKEILAAVIISLIIAAYVTYLTLSITFVGINVMYTKLVDFANHLDNYAKLQQPKNQKPPEPNNDDKKKPAPPQESKYSLANIMRHAPSPSAFIDYLTLILYRQFSSSVVQFYFLLFREVKETQIQDKELDPAQDMIKGSDAKLLYEKLCFMNHLNEQKLTDPQNIAILKTYGFEVVIKNDLQTEVFTKMTIKNFDAFLVNSFQEVQNINSLDIYVKENVKLTQFDEDQMEVDSFIKLYNDFCDYNRLPRVAISPSLMKEKYDINVNVVPQQLIMRIKQEEEDEFHQNYDLPLLQKISSWWKRGSSPKKTYVLDTSKLENHFNLVMNKETTMTQDQLSQATLDLILYPGWRLWDAITVFCHLLIGALITLPLLALVMVNESQYQPWSLKNPIELITMIDIIHDPLQLAYNLYNSFTWNIVFVILVTLLWVFSFLDLLLYYAVMEFPQDKSFKKSEDQGEERFWHKRSRQLEWVLVLVALAFYFGFIGLFLTWLLLGAFINPNAFLPFASAAVTFVTFIVTKYQYFKSLANQGSKAVMDYVNKVFGGFINKVLGKITQNLEKITTNFSQEKIKELVQSGAFKTVTGKLEEAGIVDPGTVAEYTQKLETLNAQTLVTDAVAIAKDPSILVKEAEAVGEALKQKTIQKIKDECAKRNIPPKLVDLLIAVASKSNNDQIKTLLKGILQDVNKELKLPPEGADIVVELLFPTGVNKEETVMFVTTKIITLVFKVAKLDKIKGLTPNILISIFKIFKHVEEQKYEDFIKDLKNLLKDVKLIPVTELNFFMPALDIVSVLAKDKPDHWNIKDPCFQLLNAAAYLIDEKDATKAANITKVLKAFVKILPLMFSTHETAYDLDTKKPLSPQEIIKIITNFCTAMGLTENMEKKKFIPNLIYLAYAFIKEEIHDLPKDVVKGIENMFEAEIPATSRFVETCINMTNLIFSNPKLFYQRLNKGIDSYRLGTDLQNFLKIITCYSFDGFEKHYPTISVEKNGYFVKIAQNLKANPKELLGLVDLLYGKKNSQNVDVFLKAILTRMNLSQDKLSIIRCLVDLFLSDDEAILLETMNSLNLDLGQFMLVGKRILNPRFIPASQFSALGVTDKNLIQQKDTIFYSSTENFNNWKSDLRKNIADNLNQIKKKLADNQKPEKKPSQSNAANPFPPMSNQEFQRFESHANLVKLYLSDWEAFVYSKKNIIAAINTLDNPDNQLKKKLIDYAQGASYNGADFLVVVMGVDNLRLDHGKRYNQFDKEKEGSISTLADYLSVNNKGMANFVQLFVLSGQKDILKCFYYFFPDDEEDKDTIAKILAYSFRQTAVIRKQMSFIQEDLPDVFELFDGPNNTILPSSLFMKMIFESPDVNFRVSDMLEFGFLLIRKLTQPDEKPNAKFDEKLSVDDLLMECYAFGLFARGLIPKDSVSNLLQIKDENVLGLLHMLLEPNLNARQNLLTKMFQAKVDPMKLGIALTGLLTGQTFKVGHHKVLVQAKQAPEEEPIKTYLGNIFGVYPEMFDLFDIIFERDPSKFLQKALPVIRRLTKTSVVNTNLMESLFSLLLAEHFNPNTLAGKLEISGDIIEFFISLMRLSIRTTRKKEIKDLPDSVPFNKVLSKLKIKPNEFLSLIKLIFNIIEGDDAMMELFTNLNLKNNDTKGTTKDNINVNLFKGLITINKPTDAKLDIFKNKAALNSLKTKLGSLFNYLNLNKDQDNAFLISRLAAGNFLVLEQYKENLNWIFPSDDAEAERAILNLTMGLAGLLNPNVSLYLELDKEVQSFVEQFYPKKEFKYQEPVYTGPNGAKVLPNNTLAYAIYLTYETLDIAPKWTQAFLFDREAFKTITKKMPDLKEEFLVAVILSFSQIPDIMGDFFGLYEWACFCIEYYREATGKIQTTSKAAEFKKKIQEIYWYFEEKLNLDYQKVKDIANTVGLLQKTHWAKLFAERETYNARINQSLIYLLTLEFESSDKKELFMKLKDKFRQDPSVFLLDLCQEIPKEGSHSDLDLNKSSYPVGRMFRQAIIQGYEIVTEKFYRKARIPGYALTDLCTLGVIAALRENPNTPIQRKIYNLHQVTMNAERKLYFEDPFLKMSKFKLMKIAGISMNLQISNALEFCLNRSIMDNDFVTEMEMATDSEGNKDEEKRKEIRIKQLEKFVFNLKQEEKSQKSNKGSQRKDSQKSEQKKDGEEGEDEKDEEGEEAGKEKGDGEGDQEEEAEEEEDDDDNVGDDDSEYVCDLGYYGGSFADVNDMIEDILHVDDWDSINLLLDIDDLYIINPQSENIGNVLDMFPKYEIELCKPKDGKVFASKELVELIIDDENLKDIPVERLQFKNPNYKPSTEEEKKEEEKKEEKPEEKVPEQKVLEKTQEDESNQDSGDEFGSDSNEEEPEPPAESEATKAKRLKLEESFVDVKTGLLYKTLKSKSEEFERVLLDSNMELLQGIIRGDASQLIQGDHILLQKDPEKTAAKIYMALIGLQSYNRLEKPDRVMFKDYLSILSNKIESDISKLDELLNFLMTRKPQLGETINALEIAENVADFLLMYVRERGGTVEDEEEENEESKFSVVETISKTLNIPLADVQIYDLIRNIYLVQSKAWLDIVDELIVKDPKTKAQVQPEAQKQPENPLKKLLKMFSFSKLRKQVFSGEDRRIIRVLKNVSFKNNDNHDDEYITCIFKEFILDLQIFNKNFSSKETTMLTTQFEMLLQLLQQNYPKIFRMLVLGAANSDVIQLGGIEDQTMLESIIELFGTHTQDASAQKDIRLLRLFLGLSHGDIFSLRGNDDYDMLVENIINDMTQAQILSSLKGDQNKQRIVSQFLLGLVSWDLELCIKSLIQAGATLEAFLIYNIYGCFNVDKLYSLGSKYRKQAEQHLVSILPSLFSRTLSKSVAKVFEMEAKTATKRAMTEQFENQNEEEKEGEDEEPNYSGVLQDKVRDLFQVLHTASNVKPPKTFIHHILRSLQKCRDSESGSGQTLETGKDKMTLINIWTSIFDGSFVVKLLNTFSKSKKEGEDEKIKAIALEMIQLMIQLYQFYTKKKDDQEVISTFERFLSAAQNFNVQEPWNKMLDLVPDVMEVCLIFEKGGNTNLVDIKVDALSVLKTLVSMIKDENQRNFVFDIMGVMLGIDMKNFSKDDNKGKIKYDLTIEDRIELFFNRVRDAFFPTLVEKNFFQTFIKQIYNLIVTLRTDFMQGIKDPQKLRGAVEDIIAILGEFNIVSHPLVEALIGLLDGDLEKCSDLIAKLVPKIPESVIEQMITYLQEALKLLGFDFTSKPKSLPSTQPGSTSNIDPAEWAAMMKKIKDGTASPSDLFKMVDEEGDKSGSINQTEFQTLASRLGLKLSSHRISEIFAKVKGNKVQSGGSQELNEQEFAKALAYLQEKNVNQALQLLGITPEILTAILIRLVILLMLIFVFIFLGIKAFAIGGTFGSIINSLFPAAGGLTLGQQSQGDKSKLQEENVQEAADKGFEITTSEQL